MGNKFVSQDKEHLAWDKAEKETFIWRFILTLMPFTN